MRVLIAHNRYRQQGGEEQVVANETALLRGHGVDVKLWEVDSADVSGIGTAVALARAPWSRKAAAAIDREVHSFKPDVVHVHNTFPMLSPAVYRSVHRTGTPVVATLHNYRLTCASATLMRDDAPCQDCVGKAIGWSAIRHRCYRDSFAASALVESINVVHRGAGTFAKHVDAYIALTQFARGRFVAAGLPAERIHVKPNFVDFEAPHRKPGGYLLYVGRLSREKGIRVLAEAALAADFQVRLVVAGDGPERSVIEDAARRSDGRVDYRGRVSQAEVKQLLAGASALVVPSLWYEGFPMNIVESYASGVPVIAAGHGSLGEIVKNDLTGWHVKAGDAIDLTRVMNLVTGDPSQAAGRGHNARVEYENRYTAAANLVELLNIYHGVIERRHASV